MISKIKERKKAIALRRRGLPYSRILKEVPVAKSTLSLWFQSVHLSKKQKQRLTAARIEAGKRGGARRHLDRIERTNALIEQSAHTIGKVSNRELLLIGAMLYWAEGSKEKEYHPGSRTELGNSDPAMLRVFKKWLYEIANVKEDELKYEIYLHETCKDRVQDVRKYWSAQLRVPLQKMQTIYFKKNKLKTNRKNTGNGYYGLVKIRVRNSSSLNRLIQGWIKGICVALQGGIKQRSHSHRWGVV